MISSSGAAASEPSPDLHQLIARYRDDAYRLARHLVRTHADAEDLTQTAMLNVLRRAEHISDTSYIRPYLLTAVRNLWRNQLRSKGNRRFVGADHAERLASVDPFPEDEVLTAMDVSLAARALAALSPTSREILTLRYLAELSFPELAERLGISAVAARQRAHRAREELVGACMDQVAGGGVGVCQTVRRRLGRYHRGLLSRKVRGEVVAHLAACSDCSSCYDQLVDLYGHRFTGRGQNDDHAGLGSE